MAFYVYTCHNGHERTVMHSVFDDSAIFCNECSLEMWRKPQSYAHALKGTGFYSKDK